MSGPRFEVVAPFQPAGDQPKAIRELTEGAVRKRLGAISYEPIVVTVDPCAFQPWIRHILANNHFTRRIYRIDAAGNIVGMQRFGDSYASDLYFPALDASSKDAAFLKVPDELLKGGNSRGLPQAM